MVFVCVGVYWGYLDGFGLGLVLKAGNLLQLCMCFISHVEIVGVPPDRNWVPFRLKGYGGSKLQLKSTWNCCLKATWEAPAACHVQLLPMLVLVWLLAWFGRLFGRNFEALLALGCFGFIGVSPAALTCTSQRCGLIHNRHPHPHPHPPHPPPHHHYHDNNNDHHHHPLSSAGHSTGKRESWSWHSHLWLDSCWPILLNLTQLTAPSEFICLYGKPARCPWEKADCPRSLSKTIRTCSLRICTWAPSVASKHFRTLHWSFQKNNSTDSWASRCGEPRNAIQ